MKLTLADIQFLFEQVSLPGNNPINGPFGNVPGAELLPLGIRDVQGVGNNPYNSNFGNADHFFPRATQASYISALTRGDFNPVTGTFASGAPVSYATRDVRILDNAPRVISICLPMPTISMSLVGLESRSTILPASFAACVPVFIATATSA